MAAKNWRRVLAVLMVLFTLGVIGYSAYLSDTPLAADDFGFLLGVVTTLVIGMYLVLRRPDNPIGLILEGFGAAFTLGASAEVVAVSTSPLAPWSAWLSTWQWALCLVLLLVLLPLLFPEGRLPSPGFRWVIPTTSIGLTFLLLGNAFRPTTTIDAASGEVVVDLPMSLPLTTEIFDLLSTVGMVCVLVSIVGAVTGVVRRFRNATGLERQQMKVFGTGLVTAVVMVAANLVLYSFGLSAIANVLFSLAIVAIMGSIAVAVLRYRLYDLDRAISRTITYSVVAVVVAVVYAVGAVWLPTLIAGGQSPLFVAASTLVAAAMFTPTRRRVMKWVDRRFNRSRYQAELVIDQFSASLQVRHQADEIVDGLVELVGTTFQPANTGVWIKSPQ